MITRITDIEDPRVQVFSRLTEAQLRNRLDPSRGVFIAIDACIFVFACLFFVAYLESGIHLFVASTAKIDTKRRTHVTEAQRYHRVGVRI